MSRFRLAWAVLIGRQKWANGYPTPWAYERVCETLRYERERADRLALERLGPEGTRAR